MALADESDGRTVYDGDKSGGAPDPGGGRLMKQIIATLTLPGVERSVSYARRLVDDTLGAGHPAADDLRMCISEAFTNSVLHSTSRNGGKVTLTLAAERGSVIAEVTDDGADEKPHLANDPAGIHGRGMHIIDALAAEWGIDVEEDRTTIWMRFPAPTATA